MGVTWPVGFGVHEGLRPPLSGIGRLPATRGPLVQGLSIWPPGRAEALRSELAPGPAQMLAFLPLCLVVLGGPHALLEGSRWFLGFSWPHTRLRLQCLSASSGDLLT